jgi:hypothetical protein
VENKFFKSKLVCSANIVPAAQSLQAVKGMKIRMA